MSYFDLKSLTMRWIVLSPKKWRTTLSIQTSVATITNSLVKLFPTDGAWWVDAFGNHCADHSLTPRRLWNRRPVRKEGAHIASDEPSRLAVKVTDGAFVFVNDFAFGVQPANIPSCTQAIQRHGSGLVPDIESVGDLQHQRS